jgi:hypothetical protein
MGSSVMASSAMGSSVMGSSGPVGSSSLAASSGGSVGASSSAAGSSSLVPGSSSVGAGSSSAASSSSSSGGVVYTPETFLKAINAGGCNYDERCRDQRGRRFSSVAACVASAEVTNTLFPAQGGNGETLWAFLARSSVMSQVDAQVCVDFYANPALACDMAINPPEECNNALDVANPVAVGGICGALEPECEGDTAYCARATGTPCLRCFAKGGLGDPCGEDGVCLSQYCDFTSGGFCANLPPRGVVGTTCVTTADCLTPMECLGTTTRVCTARGGPNAACNGPMAAALTLPPCQEDLDCVVATDGVAGTCRPRLADNTACTRDSVRILDSGGFTIIQTGQVCTHVCAFPTANAATGVCTNNVTQPGNGQPSVAIQNRLPLQCADGTTSDFAVTLAGNVYTVASSTCVTPKTSGSCQQTDVCAASHYCQGASFTPVTQGTCTVDKQNGVACAANNECLNGVCAGSLCAARRGNGQACAEDLNCISGFCNVDVMPAVCAAAVCQ